MHPSQLELQAFLQKKLTDRDRCEEIRRHLESCEFCTEYCDSFRQLVKPVEPLDDPMPEMFKTLADRLLADALRGSVIDLRPLLSSSEEPRESVLAADGTGDSEPGSARFLTLCSENPEVLTRVATDPESGGNYLQVLADDSRLAANVMVRLPDLDREFLTDSEGRAELDLTDAGDLEKLKWQIKMPDAVFELEPLEYDSDRTEYAEEVTLRTERDDVIQVCFEGKTEGKQITIRVVELDGQSDYDPIQVAVRQGDKPIVQTASPGRAVSFGPIDAQTIINIRLYR